MDAIPDGIIAHAIRSTLLATRGCIASFRRICAGELGWAYVGFRRRRRQRRPRRPELRATTVPGFWDPRRRPERPDTSRITLIRFATEVDYPPFNYAGADGNPTGFNVELARLICDELKIPRTIQMRRFDTLLSSLAENRADAVAASIAVDGENSRKR